MVFTYDSETNSYGTVFSICYSQRFATLVFIAYSNLLLWIGLYFVASSDTDHTGVKILHSYLRSH